MSTKPVLSLENVSISVGDREICHDVSLTINEGECHVLIGPNGSGKSSLLCGLMGIKPFEIAGGKALLGSTDLAGLSVDERARCGLGLAFQRPPSIPGVSVRRLAQAIGATSRLDATASQLGVEYLIDRDVNCGFSGGEVKRWEVAKLGLHDPTMCLLDEPESGVDLQQVNVVSSAINHLLHTPTSTGEKRAVLAITHTGFILDGVDAVMGHLMVDGRIVESAPPRELFDRIRKDGYVAA